mgnify:CR=1 FL=1
MIEGLIERELVILVALVLVVTNPVLSHATARAARIRQFGEWTVQDGEAKGERTP